MPTVIRVLCAVLGLVWVAQPVAAQDETLAFEVDVVGQPVFHRDDDRLGLRLRIANHGTSDLEGFTVEVGAGGKVTTRSQLHEIVADGTASTIGAVAVSFASESIPARGSTLVKVDKPVSSLQGISFSGGQEGVYPLAVQVKDPSTAAPLASTVTAVLYYPNDANTRLKAVPVLPLQDFPARDPSGAFVSDDSGTFPLEAALDEGGWLEGYLAALERVTETDRGLALAPTPRLLEEIADMADGYDRVSEDEIQSIGPDDPRAQAAARWLDGFRTVLGRSATQPVLVPYGFADLPALAEGPDEIGAQLRIGAEVLEEILGEAVRTRAEGWLMPPAGRVDEATFDQLPMENVVFSPDALTPMPAPELAGCPEAEYTFTCAVRIQTPLRGSATGFVLDEDVQQRLGALVRPGNGRTDVQWFFAETAMIREEQPGRGDRILAFALPATWHPRPRDARLLLEGIARAPWLRPQTPEEALAEAGSTRRRSVVADIAPALGQPDATFFDTIRSVSDLVDQYRSMSPPNDIVERLARNVLVAQGRAWWPSAEGIEYATRTEDEIDRELTKIEITGPEEITLTSKTGQIQFFILNETGYEVDIDVLVASENLTLRGEGFSTEDIDSQQHVDSEQERITFDVTTRASGIFPLEVRLQAPGGLAIGDPVPITVRSTEFNEIALGVTFGALAFLILFYAVRAMRRRKTSTRDDLEAGAA